MKIKIFAGLAGLFLLAQLVRPAKNDATGPGPNDMAKRFQVPVAVGQVLARACYDCHSNRTAYPWYAEVQPVAWWIGRHVSEGKRHLDFTQFAAYSDKRVAEKLKEIREEVTAGEMPLASYTWLHPQAKLTPEEVKLVADWAGRLEAGLPAH
ncbi:MAG: heme-binding domain-containing protein [Lacunisphaera sp.]|nr:heme-binding domain-containing protein [Lacunisphaera sp.]